MPPQTSPTLEFARAAFASRQRSRGVLTGALALPYAAAGAHAAAPHIATAATAVAALPYAAPVAAVVAGAAAAAGLTRWFTGPTVGDVTKKASELSEGVNRLSAKYTAFINQSWPVISPHLKRHLIGEFLERCEMLRQRVVARQPENVVTLLSATFGIQVNNAVAFRRWARERIIMADGRRNPTAFFQRVLTTEGPKHALVLSGTLDHSRLRRAFPTREARDLSARRSTLSPTRLGSFSRSLWSKKFSPRKRPEDAHRRRGGVEVLFRRLKKLF